MPKSAIGTDGATMVRNVAFLSRGDDHAGPPANLGTAF